MEIRNEINQSTQLHRIPIGRMKIESILQVNYRMKMGGFWRWLYHQGEIDSPNPPEDLDPCIKLMEHLSRNHNDGPAQNCEICAVWMEVWNCWQAAENHGNGVTELMRNLESQLQMMMNTYDAHIRKIRALLHAVEKLHPQHEVRKSAEKTVHTYSLYKKVMIQKSKTSEDNSAPFYSDAENSIQIVIKELENRAMLSIQRFYKYIKELWNTVECLLESPGIVYIEPQDKEFLRSLVAYNLKEAGFKPIPITDMLNGDEPLLWNEVGSRKVLSAESALKRDSIVKRIQRFSANVKRENQDADKFY